jgi:tetratricopeptide (TPR) repeat protein
MIRTTLTLTALLVMPLHVLEDSKGVALYKEGKYAEAANVLKTEVDESTDDQNLLTYLGLARVMAGDAAGAMEPLKKVLAVNEDSALAHYGMGLVYGRMKKLDDAIAELEKSVKLDPDYAYAHYQLGMAYNQKGEKALAIRHLRRFVELAPNAPEAAGVRAFLSRL